MGTKRKNEQRRKIDKELPGDGKEVEGSQEASEEAGRKRRMIPGGEAKNERNEETYSISRVEIEESREEGEGLQTGTSVPDTREMWE